MPLDPALSPHPKRFPLSLCEILEKEFITTHGSAIPGQPGSLLRKEDVCFERLLEQLRSSFPAAPATAAGAIKDLLLRASVPVPAADSWTGDECERVLAALNRALQDRIPLYDAALLESDAKAVQLASLRREKSAELNQDEKLRLNRLLLEAAFPPGVIAAADTVRLSLLFDAVHALKESDARTALCLSGGGIRSAAFCLGILQGLARCGLLERFDYLSTVSGGGYVGSWLSTWVHRHPRGLRGVARDLAGHAGSQHSTWTDKIEPGPAPIRFLRDYSSFLNPRARLFSADTWTWIGIYLRNLSLNWLALIPALLFVLALPRLYASALAYFGDNTADPLLIAVGALAALLVIICVTINRPSISDQVAPPWRDTAVWRQNSVAWRRKLGQPRAVFALGIVPLLVFAVLTTVWMWRGAAADAPSLAASVQKYLWGEAIVFLGWLVSIPLLPKRARKTLAFECLAFLFAGLLTWVSLGTLDYAAAGIAAGKGAPLRFLSFTLYPAHLYIILGVPAVLLSVLAGMTLFIGVVSKSQWIEDEDREWWARFGAKVLIWTLVWLAVSAIMLLGPPLLLEFPKLIGAIGGGAGLIALLIGKSALGPANEPTTETKNKLKAVVGVNAVAILSALFLALFLALLSLLTSALLHKWPPAFPGTMFELHRACGALEPFTLWKEAAGNVFQNPQIHLELACQTPLDLIALTMAALAAVVGVFSLAINLNKFSLHAAYRIRIARTFLGASRGRERRPNPFTGFDPLDNIQMHELQPALLLEGDIVDLPGLVARFKDAPDSDASPAGLLALNMRKPEHDRTTALHDRLRSYRPGTPVLTSLQRDLIESLNRILETVDLSEQEAFKPFLAGDTASKVRDFLAHGNLIFANRLLIEAAFEREIRPYDFPPRPPHKLVHVLNLTLNLVRGKKLAWQERKAAPFVVTPMHTGSYYLGYRESLDYGGKDGISIATAAAISGAAVSPNMGYSSSPVTALLLTLFNVRLGWWLGNPGVAGDATFTRAEPAFSLAPVFSEALGFTDDESPYVYLSDGGHFENLGIFEMVLRRCRLVVSTDAGADPNYEFGDLGNAVRKIRIDLGIPIEFRDLPIRRYAGKEDAAARYCAIGRIMYSAVDGLGAPDGTLICFKPALSGKEPRDVLHYAAANPVFPQEPTSDQFFGESQFESYRQLGEFALLNSLGLESSSPAREMSAADFRNAISSYLNSPV